MGSEALLSGAILPEAASGMRTQAEVVHAGEDPGRTTEGRRKEPNEAVG